MRLKFGWLLLALCTTLLAACGHHDAAAIRVSIGDGTIAVKKHIVIIKLKDHHNAYVLPDGRLVVGKAEVPTNADQRIALTAYSVGAKTFIVQVVNVGAEGLHFAAESVGNLLKGAINGNPDQAHKQVETGGERIKDKAKALCKLLDDWRSAQDAAVAAVPEFKPYAVIHESNVKSCWDEGISSSHEKKSGDDHDDHDEDDEDDENDWDEHPPAEQPKDSQQAPPKQTGPVDPAKGALL
jgi:hypothetical protein